MVLLRIDVYPHYSTINDKRHSTTDASQSDYWELPKSPHEPLHACLASASSLASSGSVNGDHDGTILQVGRKDADVVFSRDKSVSRKHLQIKIVAQDSQYHSDLQLTRGKDASSTDHDGTLPIAAAAAAAPRTSDELQACETSQDGMCVVLSDMGAKFGTYLVVDNKEPSGKQSTPPHDDDDETGDETEDETANNTNKGPPLSAMTASVVPNPSAKVLKRLEPNSSIVLNDLSETEAKAANKHDDRRMAVIQCGQNGSTLVITRIPMKFAFSRVDSTEKKEYQKQMYAIGATCTDNLEEMTHLVTKDKISAPKALTAWCRKVPLVTTQYIRQLIDRTSPRDPMPNPNDTIREGKEPFWKLTPNPKLWSNCTLLVLSENDMVSVVRATGVTVVDKLQAHKHLSETEFEEILITIVQQHSGCFYIETPSKRKVSRKKLLLLQKRGIPCLTSKLVAKLVTSQKPLEDEDGNAIGGQQQQQQPRQTGTGTRTRQGDGTVHITENTKDPEKSTQHHIEGRQLESQALFSNIQSSVEARTNLKAHSNDKEAAVPSQKILGQNNATGDMEGLSKISKKLRVDSSRQRKLEGEVPEGSAIKSDCDNDKLLSERKIESGVHTEIEPGRKNFGREDPSKSKKDKRNRDRDGREQESAQDTDIQDTDYVYPSGNERQPKRKKKEGKVGLNNDEAVVKTTAKFTRGSSHNNKMNSHNLKSKRVTREETETTRRTGERKKLKSSNDGWLITAPSGAERNHYRRTDTELKEKYENEHGILPGEKGYNLLTTPAIDVTDVRENLVIFKCAPCPTSTGGGSQPTAKSRGGGIDFKKFRKNNVEVASFRRSRIKLFSVLPKESDREKELFEQERQLEEEKKIAESLFRDPNGGMKSFFGKSNKQAGRKRRARV